jgi:hypothetical protein
MCGVLKEWLLIIKLLLCGAKRKPPSPGASRAPGDGGGLSFRLSELRLQDG